MRSLIHAVKAVQRNKVKTFLMFFMMFIVFNLMFSGIIIQNTITESRDYLRREMGAFVQYKIDYNKWYEDQEERMSDEYPELDFESASKIALSDYVKNMYVTTNTYLESEELNPFSPDDSDGPMIKPAFDIMPIGNRFKLSGTNNATPINHETGKITLVNPEGFTSEQLENNVEVVFVSDILADLNQLQIGDDITLTDYYENTYELEVIGFYSIAEDTEDMFIANELIVPSKMVDAINANDMYYDADSFYGEIYFQLNDAIEIDAFREEMSFYLPSEYHVLDANDAEFEKINAPLNLMELITEILVIVILIAGALITMSLITIFVKERKFEIGLLITSGESKGNIFMQLLLEIGFVALTAFLLSIGVSYVMSSYIAEWLVETQILGTTVNQDTWTFTYGVYNLVTLDDIASQFEVGINGFVMFKMFLIQAFIVLASGLVPMVVIASYKPREIIAD
jgi:putative ABC transport system permease protein